MNNLARFSLLVAAFVVACTNAAQPQPLKLAIIPTAAPLTLAADALAVSLSKDQNVSLLERAEIERVLREQSLSATTDKVLKLGQILGADGLLLLELLRQSDRQVLSLRLVATKALKALPDLERATVTPAASAKEYVATLVDIEAMAHLGLYYSAKIRGACDLALFDKSGDAKQQASAVQHLEAALSHWKNFSAAYTCQYVQPVHYNRAGLVDIPKQTQDVAADVQMARDWKPGTIDEAKIKRSGTGAGFSK